MKKLDHALNTKYHWELIKTILFYLGTAMGKKNKEDVL